MDSQLEAGHVESEYTVSELWLSNAYDAVLNFGILTYAYSVNVPTDIDKLILISRSSDRSDLSFF